MKYKEYEVYHDESKEGGYWHVFIFIPKDKKEFIFDHLIDVKKKINPSIKELTFKKVGSAKQTHDKPRVMRYWLSFLLACMQQKKEKKFYPVYYSLDENISSLAQIIGIKIVVFKVDNKHKDMFNSMSELSKIETTMRIALKGGLHKLFTGANYRICNLFVDGNEHYLGEYGRDLDQSRIIGRLENELQKNILISDDFKITPIARKKFNPNHINRLFIQLADLALGSVRWLHQVEDEKNIRYWISEPFCKLMNRDQNNVARMKNSRFDKAFSFSGAYIDNEVWNFYNIEKASKNVINSSQLALF